MYLRNLHYEQKTSAEQASSNREYFCKNLLPDLNLIRDENFGRAYVNYVFNRLKTKPTIVDHFYQNYSNQPEEKLFREAEEYRYVDKNPLLVQEIEYTAIDKSKIGLSPTELKELLTNPTKRKAMTNALKAKYRHYNPLSKWELKRKLRNRMGLIDTVIEENIDTNNPEENNYSNLVEKTFSNPDRTEDEEVANAYHLNLQFSEADETNTYPLGKPYPKFHYSLKADFSEYGIDVPEGSLVSPQKWRYELMENTRRSEYLYKYWRKYSWHWFASKELFVIPHLERNNEDIQERLFKRKPLQSFKDRECLYSNEMEEMRKFVNFRLEQDTSKISDDDTENEINQAVFEAQYTKPVEESDEYKSLERRNRYEIEALFKALDIEPHEDWFDPKTVDRTLKPRYYKEWAQYNDPMYNLLSEVEQPHVLRKVLRDWRSGAEIRFRMPYYPETKKPEAYFTHY